jgi:transcriptional regulator with XRE-family HTH domain
MKLIPEGPSERDPITEQLLQLLRRSRRSMGLTVRELAERAGVSPSYISLIENGHKVPDAGTIQRIGEALELDPELLKAWVTVRSRTDDATEAVSAAHDLIERLEISNQNEGMVRESSVAYATRPFQAEFWSEGRGRTVPVPLLPEGAEPSGGLTRQRPLLLDERMADRVDLSGAWAWRVTRVGVERIPGVYRPGDFVVISPTEWSPAPGRIHPLMVFAVRHDRSVLLSRVLWTGDSLVLQPGGRQPAVVLPASGASALRKLIAGRVVAAVVGF